MARMPLREVDKVEILTLLDTIDILVADTPQPSDSLSVLMPSLAKASWPSMVCRAGECQQQ